MDHRADWIRCVNLLRAEFGKSRNCSLIFWIGGRGPGVTGFQIGKIQHILIEHDVESSREVELRSYSCHFGLDGVVAKGLAALRDASDEEYW